MKTQRRRVFLRVLDLVLLLLLLTATIAGVSWFLRLRQHLRSAQASLEAIETAFVGSPQALLPLLQDPAGMAALEESLANLEADLDALERLLGPVLPLSEHLGWFPGIGSDLAAAPHLLDMAQETTGAARTLVGALGPLAERLHQADAGLGNLGPELVTGLEQAKPQIEFARAALARAAQARTLVDATQNSTRIADMIARFDRYLPLIENGTQALAVLPGLLGADSPRTYLLLAQNNHELRPTGGFISGVGRIGLDRGEITGVHFQDSYTVDDLSQPHPPPPAPLRRHMGAGMLVLRDANWWPDFPTSAQVIADLYNQDQGQAVDGVIAVDLTTLTLLLRALGPIEVPGYDQPVNSGNLQSMLMSFWQAPETTAPGKEDAQWWLHRKDFTADLVSALLSHLAENATAENLTALVQATGQALRERHALIYVTSPGDSVVLSETGWDGALRPFAGDYLMVVDSNVGFNKANPNVEQTLDYRVSLDGAGQATAHLTLTYRHRIQRPSPACVHESHYGDSYADMLERCYWDYLRVYVPAGSEVLQVLGADEPAEVYEEDGRTVIATSFLVETGQARRIEIHYQPNLPPSENHYALLIQKQPGTGALPLRVGVTLPSGTQPASLSPPGAAWLDGKAVWQGVLSQDLEIELSWE